MMQVLIEFAHFLKHQKRYWLLPVFLVLIILGILIVFGQGSILVPFIYTLV